MKNIIKEIKQFIKEEYIFLIVLLVITLISLYPVKYYIITGGGVKNIGKRVIVDDAYKEKGTFNISYVTELNGTVISYLLSYVIPGWTREPESNYQYNDEESIEEVNNRSLISLDQSSNNAIYNAFTLANKEVSLESKKIYVYTKITEYDNPFVVGDELIEINNKKISNLEDIRKELQLCKEDTINIKIKRNNKEKTLKVKIYKDKETGTNIVGIVATTVKEYKTNPKVNVKFATNEAGPSGGLITALSIYNKLVEEDITKGRTIAGTGTMEDDGTVGEIGGVEYKVIGASKKADIFLVPAGDNYKKAMEIKKKEKLKIKIIPVESLEDAINKLK
jgi:PDZ domain-containing protein